MMQHLLTILVVVFASLLRAMDLLTLERFEYNQIVKYSDPLVQLAAVSAVFIAVKAGPGSGIALFATFILLTLVWTLSLGHIGLPG